MPTYKKWIKAVVGTALGLSLSLAGLPALAADLNWPQDTTVTVNGNNYTILGGSAATSLAVGATTLTVTVPTGSTFTVRSSDRYLLNNDQSLSQVCTDTNNTLTINGPVNPTVIITPSATACTVSNPGGGGSPSSGGSGSPSVTADTTPPTDTSLVIAGNATTTATTLVTLTLAATGASDMMVSNNSDFSGASWETYATSRSWTLTAGNGTKTVYAKFKDTAGNTSAAVSDTITLTGQAATAPPVSTPPAAAPQTTPAAAPAGAHPNGTLVLDGATVFLIKDGKRYGFRDPNEYKSHGFNFGQVVAANAQDKALPQAEFVQKALEGTLVLDASDGKTVYMIGTGSAKRGFVSEAIFKSLGYSFANLPKINLADYPVGPVIATASAPHPDGSLVIDGATIWWIRGNNRQGFESMAVFNTYGFTLNRVVKANAADLALAEGSIVKFRDGTLVKDGADYYLISDGKKLKFASATDLTSRGYKTANALSASLAAYQSGGSVQ